ncbi:MAG: YgiQ family radical SAM protein [Candidatus Amulumruptor caecigallinarius]|uniref:YgiQ family radical SAM protein n=1 Tax=Candidatus Amulumruptor caecigallinarius TaxID=2109911 RepID=A0A4Q0U8V4_9BACT|nr:MAG: YgiQ family radical SAM protein [Candidatus Amulumruptor caecigallinarius]HJE40121.1 YgiQ family radical SAM protein [Candidatus Amulumruptor caecigallinarius]
MPETTPSAVGGQLWLPTTAKELQRLGWEQCDVILFSGDAYVDHPAFGAAVIGRVLQSHGYKVAIVPQPNWQDDLRDFKKLGRPRLFFGVSPGAMDSMVNHYTAARRLRHDDAYTPGGRHGARPDYPSIVYTKILKELYPDIPVVLGGIEPSLRRLSHYDYWQDRLRPSILMDSPADMLVYGMGEKTTCAIAAHLDSGLPLSELTDLEQTVILLPKEMTPQPDDSNIVLHSMEECLASKRCQAENFKHIEQQSNRYHGATLWQVHGDKVVKVNPMYPPMTTEEIDASFDLPYTRLPHPRYRGKVIPAYEMIRHSVNMHRGCFGGCAFCTISAHQGKFIASRSKESILREVRQVTQMEDFKGYISDLGGPSANMYAMHGKNLEVCQKCLRPSCLHPRPCPNLNNDHGPLLDIYKAADAIPGVKKSFIGSGVRYDLSMHVSGNPQIDAVNRRYNEELIARHVSGRLKVAPEHTEDAVLDVMRKPSFSLFHRFKEIFDKVNRKHGLKQQLIPYFISSHPGCHESDMANLAVKTKELDFHLEQVQDFTPTPMTLATEIYYTGYHPYTLERVYTARTKEEKESQRQFFFWYDRQRQQSIVSSLKRLHREDLIKRLFPSGIQPSYRRDDYTDKRQHRNNPPKRNRRK